MTTNRKEEKCVLPELVGKQSLLLVQFELVDEHTLEVLFLFFSKFGILQDALNLPVHCLPPLLGQLLHFLEKLWRGDDLHVSGTYVSPSPASISSAPINVSLMKA